MLGRGPQRIATRSPVGKQRNEPRAGCSTPGSSGIWQTVWMEPVRAAHIDKLDITADLTGFTVTPRVSGTSKQRAEVVVSTPDGEEVARSIGTAGATLRLTRAEPAPVDAR